MPPLRNLLLLFAVSCILVPSALSQSVVQRSGTHLTLDGAPYRFGGSNIEWLGLEGYGPHDPLGPRYPSHVEIDDAMATAAEMGARVVRSQTMGDTVGCPLCIEPELGKFNDMAFQASDYAIASAARHNIRLIISLLGDCATCAGGGLGQFLAWTHKQNPQDFFTDPQLLAAFEHHVDAVLNHRNSITGVLYRDDPTILAWENCNMCGLFAEFMHGDLGQVAAWSETIGKHIKQHDSHHLYLDTTGIFRGYPAVLDNPSIDAAAFEEYPHWDALLGPNQPKTTVEIFSQDAAAVTKHGKVFIVNEYGWDITNWKTPDDLKRLLESMTRDSNIAGDLFWALQAHETNFGFQLIPADVQEPAYAAKGESGQWWALYYPGRKTLVNTAEDMATRAQLLRTHAYAIAGSPVPKHAVPPAPVITSVVFGSLVVWRGSPGAVKYSVERLDAASGKWQLICDKCATDADDPWPDPHPGGFLGAKYRVTAYNADGTASEPSQPY